MIADRIKGNICFFVQQLCLFFSIFMSEFFNIRICCFCFLGIDNMNIVIVKHLSQDTLQNSFDYSIDEEQIQAILNRTFHANEKASKHINNKRQKVQASVYKGQEKPRYKKKYLIVDGYNIVHAWTDLKALVEDNFCNVSTFCSSNADNSLFLSKLLSTCI